MHDGDTFQVALHDSRSARQPCIRDAPSFALQRTRERPSRQCDHTIETTHRSDLGSLREMIVVDR